MAPASSSKSAKSKQSPYITHRMIASPEQFNEEAKKWFRRAYDMDAR
jgi:hypothetical protein